MVIGAFALAAGRTRPPLSSIAGRPGRAIALLSLLVVAGCQAPAPTAPRTPGSDTSARSVAPAPAVPAAAAVAPAPAGPDTARAAGGGLATLSGVAAPGGPATPGGLATLGGSATPGGLAAPGGATPQVDTMVADGRAERRDVAVPGVGAAPTAAPTAATTASPTAAPIPVPPTAPALGPQVAPYAPAAAATSPTGAPAGRAPAAATGSTAPAAPAATAAPSSPTLAMLAPAPGKAADVAPAGAIDAALYSCVRRNGRSQEARPITFEPKVETLCRRHPEMGPCQYERQSCRLAGGRVYTAGGEEITLQHEAEYDRRVLRTRFRAN